MQRNPFVLHETKCFSRAELCRWTHPCMAFVGLSGCWWFPTLLQHPPSPELGAGRAHMGRLLAAFLLGQWDW